MNLALWLERAGHEHPGRPAVAVGTRALLDYGALAERVAKLAGALKGFGLKPGDRVAIVSKNSSHYLETLYAIWHAGLAAVPANAKLHGAELGYILEHSGARVCFVSPGLDAEIAAHAPRSSRANDRRRQPRLRETSGRRSGCAHPARRQRSRLAVLHVRHDRPAERRDADAPQSRGDERCLRDAGRCRRRPAIRSCMRRR